MVKSNIPGVRVAISKPEAVRHLKERDLLELMPKQDDSAGEKRKESYQYQ